MVDVTELIPLLTGWGADGKDAIDKAIDNIHAVIDKLFLKDHQAQEKTKQQAIIDAAYTRGDSAVCHSCTRPQSKWHIIRVNNDSVYRKASEKRMSQWDTNMVNHR